MSKEDEEKISLDGFYFILKCKTRRMRKIATGIVLWIMKIGNKPKCTHSIKVDSK
jgi:hypothetical protein